MNILIYQFHAISQCNVSNAYLREISLLTSTIIFWFTKYQSQCFVNESYQDIYIIVWIELSWWCSFVNLLWDFIYKRKPGFSASVCVCSEHKCLKRLIWGFFKLIPTKIAKYWKLEEFMSFGFGDSVFWKKYCLALQQNILKKKKQSLFHRLSWPYSTLPPVLRDKARPDKQKQQQWIYLSHWQLVERWHRKLSILYKQESDTHVCIYNFLY